MGRIVVMRKIKEVLHSSLKCMSYASLADFRFICTQC